MISVAVLYVCTGKYSRFFNGFYSSAMELLLPDANKQFFVWTDDGNLGKDLDNVHTLYRICKGFPEDSLHRYDMFLEIKEELMSFDYVFFFNSNALFLQLVGDDVLPDESGLVACRWPGRREKQNPMFYPYERNKLSSAYIPPHNPPYYYFMGGLNGGTPSAFLKMAETISTNIHKDKERGIHAYVQDESYLNQYLREHPSKVLDSTFAIPEEFTYKSIDYKPKIIFRDKTRLDPYFNKGRDRTLIGRIRKGFKVLWRVVSWYF